MIHVHDIDYFCQTLFHIQRTPASDTELLPRGS